MKKSTTSSSQSKRKVPRKVSEAEEPAESNEMFIVDTSKNTITFEDIIFTLKSEDPSRSPTVDTIEELAREHDAKLRENISNSSDFDNLALKREYARKIIEQCISDFDWEEAKKKMGYGVLCQFGDFLFTFTQEAGGMKGWPNYQMRLAMVVMKQLQNSST